MVKYMASIKRGTQRNCLQLTGQGQEKITFEKETSASQHIMGDLKICC